MSFDAYHTEFHELATSVEQGTSTGRTMQQAEKTLKLLKMEMRLMGGAEKGDAKAKVAEATRKMEQLRRAAVVGGGGGGVLGMAGGSGGGAVDAQFNRINETSQQSTRKLEEAAKTAADSEEMATEIMGQLAQNRETIKGIRDKVMGAVGRGRSVGGWVWWKRTGLRLRGVCTRTVLRLRQ